MNTAELEQNRWTIDRAIKYMERFGVVKGCNYVPAYCYNHFHLWFEFDEVVINRELSWARGIGLNSIRIHIPCFAYQVDREMLFRRVDRFLEIIARNDLSVMLVLQPSSVRDPDLEPVSKQEIIVNFRPGVHHGQSMRFPGAVYYAKFFDRVKPMIKDFIQTTICRYANDKRIIAWDLYEEPCPNDRVLVEFAFACAREANPSQPLTVCWNAADLSDIYSFHTFAPPGGPPIAMDLLTFADEIKYAVSSRRPALCTEFLARSFGNTLASVLPHFSKHSIGWYVWGLCAGAAQYHYPWVWPEGSPEPKHWFHCLLYPDGTPYSYEEVELIRTFKFRPQDTKKLSQSITWINL